MDNTEFLELAHKRFIATKDAWRDIFAASLKDLEFVNGDMWDGRVKRAREQQGLSCLNVDKISPKVATIVANMRSNMPSVKVHAVSEGASENTAKIFDGLIRSIEYRSNAKQARINGHQCNVISGIGAWRIIPVEEDEEVELTYERILDPTTVLMDPAAKAQDFSDADYAFLVNWISKDQFRRDYPKVDIETYDDTYQDWYDEEMVQVVEYWMRNSVTKKFEFYLLNGPNILSENKKYPGKYVPIMFLTGKEYAVQGRREYKGVVRTAKDSQILHNLVKARAADYVARSAEPQWLVEEEQINDHPEWDSANVSGAAVLTYSGTSSGGKPQRIDPLQAPNGLIEMANESDEDIRALMGVREPTQDIPQSQSGKAIALQISQGNIGTFEFADKLNDMVMYEGRVLVDLIPHFYSYEHIRAIMGLDGKVTPIPLNQTYMDNGEQVMHDLSKGKYMVTISTGPSYESQRAEGADRMIELVGKWPDLMPLAGDLVVAGMDFKGAEELAARLKASIPPNILAASDATNGDKSGQQIAQLQAQLAQMGQQLDQMNQQGQMLAQENQQLKQAQDSKSQEIQLKAQADIQTTQIKAQSEAELTQGKASIEMQVAQAKMQFERELLMLKMAHEKEMKLLDLQTSGSMKAAEIQATGQQRLDQIAAQGDVQAQLLDIGNAAKSDQQQTEIMARGAMQQDTQAHAVEMLGAQTEAGAFMAQLNAELQESKEPEKEEKKED